MVQRELLLFKMRHCPLLLFLIFLNSCTSKNKPMGSEDMLASVNTSNIPNDTIPEASRVLKLVNGIYYLEDKLFSGYIKSCHENGMSKSIGSYYQGKQHGTTTTFYTSGELRDERSYQNNFSYGRQIGFWQNGKKKFDFVYYNDKREGLQKQWYESGEPYAFLNYSNDMENGMQKAWRENGKLYINYEVKDGVRYGLQKSALCYTLRDGKIK